MAKCLIITGYGLNCERETQAAFEHCGAQVSLLHFNQLLARPETLQEHDILTFIGGFSFGDHLGAGVAFANKVRHQLGEALDSYVAGGRLVLGICNGMQVITRLGLLPASDGQTGEPQAAMARNDNDRFRDDWVTVRANPESPCVFTRGLDSLALPIRHGEGKFSVASQDVLDRIIAQGQICLQYCAPESGEPTEEFPDNPNGSPLGIAGVCDPTGRILGMMPHPEAYLSPYNHPHWTRQKLNGVLPAEGLGVAIFRNAVDFVG